MGTHILRQEGNMATQEKEGKTIYQMDVDYRGGLWIKNTEGKINYTSTKDQVKDLYERYGHISFDTLKTLPEYPKDKTIKKPRCEACEKGKATKPPLLKSNQAIRTIRPLE